MLISQEIYQYVQNNQQINQNTYAEKLNCEIDRIVHDNTYQNDNEYFDLKIRRLIQSNKVALEFTYRNLDWRINKQIIKSTIANKEFKFNLVKKRDGLYYYQAILELQNDWKQFTFDKLRNICIDIFNQESNKGPLRHLYTINYKFQYAQIQQQIRITSENAYFKFFTLAHYKFFNSIDFKESLFANSDMQFLHVNFIPTKFEHAKYIDKLYKIQMYKKWEKSSAYIENFDQTDFNGFQIESKSISGSNEKLLLQLEGNNKIDNVAIKSYSHYNKTLQKTIIDPNYENAKQGYILPLNFAGNFSHKCIFNFGEGIKNIELNYNQTIPKAFFNYENGYIKLNVIENDNFKKLDMEWSLIKQKNIKAIVEKANNLLDIKRIGEM